MNETYEFKILPEFPNYEIFNNGDVYNKNTNFPLLGTIHTKGYRRFSLFHISGKQKNIFHHQMIARCFIENPNNYQEIDHKDGNKLNNNISNLRWCSRSENMKNRNKYRSKKEFPQSKFKFVKWCEKKKKWIGHIKINGKNKYISYGNNDEEIYIKCLQQLCDISKTEELLFYNKQVLNDMIKYEILIIYS
jgi:hypothetical protein